MAEKLFKNKMPDPPKMSAGWSGGDSLGTKIEKMLTRFMQGAFLWSYEFIAEMLVHVFDASMKILQPGARRMFNPILDWAEKQEFIPPELKTIIQNVKKEEGEAAIIGLVVTFLGIMMSLFGGALDPVSRRLSHISDVFVRSWIPSPNEIAMYERLGLIDPQVAQKALWNNGVPEEFTAALKETSKNILDVGEIMAGRWRKLLNDADFVALLKRRGYDERSITVLDDLSHLIPPISDLIRFQVREAFNDGVASKFGYDADYPKDLDPYIERQGYDPDWGKRFWRAHWDLPSPMQAYQMLHRGLIDAGTLDELLKTKDYPSFWRDKLMAISYNVMTRVDVRRLLQAGLIDAEKAKKTYLEMGYKPEDAELLTEFAIRGISQDERDLTKAEIIGMYKDGLLDGSSLINNLIKMGYDQSEADQLQKQADFDIAKAARTDAINYTKEMYLIGQMDKGQAQSELSTAGLSGKSIDRYLMAWERSKALNVKTLSLADLRRMYPKGVISLDEFKKGLQDLNYSADAIDKYVKEVQADEQTSNTA